MEQQAPTVEKAPTQTEPGDTNAASIDCGLLVTESDPWGQCPIAELPEDVLLRCLSLVPTVTERTNLRQVCHTWCGLLETCPTMWHDMFVDYHAELEAARTITGKGVAAPSVVRMMTWHIHNHREHIFALRLRRCLFAHSQLPKDFNAADARVSFEALAAICGLPRLRHLELGGVTPRAFDLSTLDFRGIGDLTALRCLHVTFVDTVEPLTLPDSLQDLPFLHTLKVHSTRSSMQCAVPPFEAPFAGWCTPREAASLAPSAMELRLGTALRSPSLRLLDIVGADLSHLRQMSADAIAGCRIEHLRMAACHLSPAVSHLLESMPHLRTLDLSRCNLNELAGPPSATSARVRAQRGPYPGRQVARSRGRAQPLSLFGGAALPLTHLDLSFGHLCHLPLEVAGMGSLRSLVLGGNPLCAAAGAPEAGAPGALPCGRHLALLDLSWCGLPSVPPLLRALPALRTLRLRPTPVSTRVVFPALAPASPDSVLLPASPAASPPPPEVACNWPLEEDPSEGGVPIGKEGRREEADSEWTSGPDLCLKPADTAVLCSLPSLTELDLRCDATWDAESLCQIDCLRSQRPSLTVILS